MLEQIFNGDGSPKIENDKFVYREILKPDWSGFRTAFSTCESWTMYGTKNPFIAARLELLAMQENPDINTINLILQNAFSILDAKPEWKEEWQSIADQFNINLNFSA